MTAAVSIGAASEVLPPGVGEQDLRIPQWVDPMEDEQYTQSDDDLMLQHEAQGI